MNWRCLNVSFWVHLCLLVSFYPGSWWPNSMHVFHHAYGLSQLCLPKTYNCSAIVTASTTSQLRCKLGQQTSFYWPSVCITHHTPVKTQKLIFNCQEMDKCYTYKKWHFLPLSTFLVTYTKPSSSITMPTGELIWPEEVYKTSTCHKHWHTVISSHIHKQTDQNQHRCHEECVGG